MTGIKCAWSSDDRTGAATARFDPIGAVR